MGAASPGGCLTGSRAAIFGLRLLWSSEAPLWLCLLKAQVCSCILKQEVDFLLEGGNHPFWLSKGEVLPVDCGMTKTPSQSSNNREGM